MRSGCWRACERNKPLTVLIEARATESRASMWASVPDLGVHGMKREEGFLERSAGVRLYRCEWWPEPARDTGVVLVLMHGYAEHCRRYDELAEYLVQRGIAVCRIDARGDGRSSGQRGYIERFEEYTDDLRGYVERV